MAKSDIGIGVGLIAVSAWFFYDSFNIRQSTITAPMASASFFPRVVSVLLAVSAVWMIGKELAAKRKARSAASAVIAEEESDEQPQGGSEKFVIYMMAAAVVYIIIIPVLGYLVSTIVYMVVSCIFLGSSYSKRRWITALIAVAISISAYLLFNLVLSVFLPSGLLI